MSKNIIHCMATDFHLKKDNIDEVLNLTDEIISIMKEKDIGSISLLGDLFDSRVSQREDVFNAMGDILDKFYEANLEVNIVVGNHDKTNYRSKRSFLEQFKHHPSVYMYDEYGMLIIDGYPDIIFHMMPFFEWGSEIHDEHFDLSKRTVEENSDAKHVLFGHMAVEGSKNNDGSKVTGAMTRGELSCYDMVFLGHYHNTHAVGKNIVHIPSLRQNNFGEDKNKGLTILYDDLSYEVIPLNSTKYSVYRFDLDVVTPIEVLDMAHEVMGNGMIRFEIIGSPDKVRGLESGRFEELGIDVKKKYSDIEVISDSEKEYPKVEELTTWSEGTIKCAFDEFCGEESIPDTQRGADLLREIIMRSNGKEV